MRQTVVLILIIAGILPGVLGVLAVYLRDTVVDSDEFARRAVTALDDPAVGALIAEKVVDQVVAAEPDALALRPLLEQVVASAVAAPAFRSAYEAAIRDLHRTVFLGNTDTVVVRLTDMVLIVKTQAAVLAPELSAAIPDGLTDTLINVQSHPLTVDALQFSEDIRLLAFVLPLAALMALGSAVLLATDHRQGLLMVGLSIVAIGVIVLVFEVVLGAVLVGQFAGKEAGAVARAFWKAFASDLGVWALVISGTGATLVASIWWLSAPFDVATRLGQLRRLIDPPSATFPRIVWLVIWALTGAFLILRWQDAIRLVVTLVGVVLLVNALAKLLSLIAPKKFTSAPARVAATGRIGRGWLVLVGGLLLTIIAGGYFAVDRIGGEGVVDVTFDPGCNGHVLLCDRRLDDVAIAATHNSMSSAEDGFLLANHSRGIISQLESGYRGLLIDLHYGLHSDRTPIVVTDRAPLTPDEREGLIRELGAAAVRSAEELRRRNLDANGTRQVYLCHALCELGATRFSDELNRIRRWLESNPREVLIIIIEDHVPPGAIDDAFEEAGLGEYLHTQALEESWPTLGQMIDSDKRLVLMTENDTGGLPRFHPVFTFTQETPYSFETVEEFSCESNRGQPPSPLFMINHWVTPPRADTGARANSTEYLLKRIEVCREVRGKFPNILAVDFYDEGDTLNIVAGLNRLR